MQPMRKAVFVLTLSLLTLVASEVKMGWSQEASKAHTTKTPPDEDSVEAYRVDLSFIELEDGKKLNTRHYSIDLTGRRPNEIKIGTRVPVATANCNSSSSSASASGSEQYQYLDIGTRAEAQLISHGDELHVSGDISTLDTSAGPEVSARLLPVIRQIKIEGSTALVLGKPIIMGSADDPNSKRQFQLEVTVTKLN